MKRCRTLKFFSLILCFFFLFFPAFSQFTPTRLLFVFDDSFSMQGRWQTANKIDVAKRLFSEFLDSLKDTPNLEVALRIYGHQHKLQPKRNCEDTKLEVPFGTVKKNALKMKAKIKSLEPTGTTPIAYTLGKCADDFPNRNGRNIIILITDGIEECEGDPCAVSLALQKKGIILKPFVIGIGLDVAFADAFKCIGKYYDATTETGFKNILNIVVSQALNNTTVQVNLLDQIGKPSETDVNMTFYDNFSGAIRYNYLHTMNYRGLPDTLVIDPIGAYNLVVHTVPPMEKKNIALIPGKHNVIALDAPQGYLYLKVNGLNNYKVLKCVVRKKGQLNTLNVQDFLETGKYIIGEYDLEILSLPRINLNSVNIAQSSTTTIEIPEAGNASIQKPSAGPGSIYVEEKGKMVWVCNLEEKLMQETITLQPGKYRVEYRSSNSKEAIYTIERQFKIESGASTQVKLY